MATEPGVLTSPQLAALRMLEDDGLQLTGSIHGAVSKALERRGLIARIMIPHFIITTEGLRALAGEESPHA